MMTIRDNIEDWPSFVISNLRGYWNTFETLGWNPSHLSYSTLFPHLLKMTSYLHSSLPLLLPYSCNRNNKQLPQLPQSTQLLQQQHQSQLARYLLNFMQECLLSYLLKNYQLLGQFDSLRVYLRLWRSHCWESLLMRKYWNCHKFSVNFKDYSQKHIQQHWLTLNLMLLNEWTFSSYTVRHLNHLGLSRQTML